MIFTKDRVIANAGTVIDKGDHVRWSAAIPLYSKRRPLKACLYRFQETPSRVFGRPKDLCWCKKKSNDHTPTGDTVPAIALFHIPLRQYPALWNDGNLCKQGEDREPVFYEEDDGQAYEGLV